jgi:hypothetical protein
MSAIHLRFATGWEDAAGAHANGRKTSLGSLVPTQAPIPPMAKFLPTSASWRGLCSTPRTCRGRQVEVSSVMPQSPEGAQEREANVGLPLRSPIIILNVAIRFTRRWRVILAPEAAASSHMVHMPAQSAATCFHAPQLKLRICPCLFAGGRRTVLSAPELKWSRIRAQRLTCVTPTISRVRWQRR